MADISTGSPASIDDVRATFIPCDASGNAQPIITSSISETSTPARATASLIATAPISSDRVFFSVPFGAFPTAVRTADTITASFIFLLVLRNAHINLGRLQNIEQYPRLDTYEKAALAAVNVYLFQAEYGVLRIDRQVRSGTKR